MFSNRRAICYEKAGAPKRTKLRCERLIFRDRITELQSGYVRVPVDITARPGMLRRLLRWVRHGFARTRPSEMMITPEPAALAAWRGLLGLPQDRD